MRTGVRIGFTGTRHGMTDEQRRAFIEWAKAAGATEFHHGCCIGADEDAFDVMTSARDLGFTFPRTVAHPPTRRSEVCLSSVMLSDERREPMDYLARNRAIVRACDRLVACPQDDHEVPFGGTWYTIRYARKLGKPVTIIWPDGRVES